MHRLAVLSPPTESVLPAASHQHLWWIPRTTDYLQHLGLKMAMCFIFKVGNEWKWWISTRSGFVLPICSFLEIHIQLVDVISLKHPTQQLWRRLDCWPPSLVSASGLPQRPPRRRFVWCNCLMTPVWVSAVIWPLHMIFSPKVSGIQSVFSTFFKIQVRVHFLMIWEIPLFPFDIDIQWHSNWKKCFFLVPKRLFYMLWTCGTTWANTITSPSCHLLARCKDGPPPARHAAADRWKPRQFFKGRSELVTFPKMKRWEFY